MRNKFITSTDIQELLYFCKKNATNIVIEHHNEDKEKVKYYRDLYVGYLYGKKVALHLKKTNTKMTTVELFNHIKKQKNNFYGHRGTDLALYDIMNFIADL